MMGQTQLPPVAGVPEITVSVNKTGVRQIESLLIFSVAM